MAFVLTEINTEPRMLWRMSHYLRLVSATFRWKTCPLVFFINQQCDDLPHVVVHRHGRLVQPQRLDRLHQLVQSCHSGTSSCWCKRESRQMFEQDDFWQNSKLIRAYQNVATIHQPDNSLPASTVKESFRYVKTYFSGLQIIKIDISLSLLLPCCNERTRVDSQWVVWHGGRLLSHDWEIERQSRVRWRSDNSSFLLTSKNFLSSSSTLVNTTDSFGNFLRFSGTRLNFFRN